MEKLVKQILKPLPSFKRHGLFNDWVLKIISLFFAIFLWYFVVGEDKVDVNLLIPVEIVNLPRDLVISNQYKKELDVTVSGSRGLIRGMSRQNLTKTVDLSGAEPGTVVIRNTPESLSLPRGIRVMRIQPTHLIFLLDRLVQREAKIKPVIHGSPKKGYELVSIELEPDSIMLNGPDALLSGQTVLETDPIDISGMTATEVRQVHLDLKPELAELIGESIVTAKITIREKIKQEILHQVPIQILHTDKNFGYQAEPDVADVEISAPENSSSQTGPTDELLLLQVDADKLPIGRHTLPVEAVSKQRVTVKKIDPPQIQLDISRIIEPDKWKIKKKSPPENDDFSSRLQNGQF